MPDCLNFLSFPYPKIGDIKRPRGQGCLHCIHNRYCPEYFKVKKTYPDKGIDENVGCACASWSDDPEKRIDTPSKFDVEWNIECNNKGLLYEPNERFIKEHINVPFYRNGEQWMY